MNNPYDRNPFKPLGQKAAIIEYLNQHESITRLDSINDLGIIELPARIVELEREGYEIPRESYEGISKSGRRYRSTRYLRPVRWP